MHPPATILVPGTARNLLGDPPPGILPVFYDRTRPRLSHRILRKVGIRDTGEALDASVRVEGPVGALDRVVALWLAPEVYLPPTLVAAWLDRLPAVRWVYSQVAGTDHLDLSLFRNRGIMVSNSGSLVSASVAEMALACVCAHVKRLPAHFAAQRRRQWWSLPAADMAGQTVGIIGTGNIGAHLATLCRALDMHVIGASRNPRRFEQDPGPYHQVVSLDTDLHVLLGAADHVVVAVPLAAETRGLIGRDALAAMRPGASLIAVTRGLVVNEDALCHALATAQIGAAYVDRPTRIPLPKWSRLYRTPNLVLTHYSAANSPRRLERACARFLAGLQLLREGGQPPDRVV